MMMMMMMMMMMLTQLVRCLPKLGKNALSLMNPASLRNGSNAHCLTWSGKVSRNRAERPTESNANTDCRHIIHSGRKSWKLHQNCPNLLVSAYFGVSPSFGPSLVNVTNTCRIWIWSSCNIKCLQVKIQDAKILSSKDLTSVFKCRLTNTRLCRANAYTSHESG